MFDEEYHKRAIKDFIAYLRTITSQKNLAFFSDISREYVRSLGKGEGIPTVKVLFNIIEAAGLDISEGIQQYIAFLQKQHTAMAAEKNAGLSYIRKTKSSKQG